MNTQSNTYKYLLGLVGIFFVIWGYLGLKDLKNYTYEGYQSTNDFSVIEVKEGSPAALAGMQVGDIIKSSGGIAITDYKSLTHRERAKVGEVREYVVTRNGEDVTLQLTFAALPELNQKLNLTGFLIGLIFILLAIYTYTKIGSNLSLSFALFSIAFGSTFLRGPYLDPGFLSSFVNALFGAILMFSFVFLAILVLKYPPRSQFLDDENIGRILYSPAILIVLIISVFEFFPPEGSPMINTVINLIFGIILIFYFGLSIFTLIQKYKNADPEVRISTGLNYMLWGTVIGLVPVLIYFIVNTIAPKFVIPGSEFIFLTFAAIPVFFTLALFKLKDA
ncbi:MAG: PDZ domain-containing protein [Saprospiraceae bacterium]|nr:PDZ domain-containing protein [Saprospiraceae bacterium]